jgi:hypothetical protein
LKFGFQKRLIGWKREKKYETANNDEGMSTTEPEQYSITITSLRKDKPWTQRRPTLSTHTHTQKRKRKGDSLYRINLIKIKSREREREISPKKNKTNRNGASSTKDLARGWI